MESHELMIGNWVLDELGNEYQVKEIHENTIVRYSEHLKHHIPIMYLKPIKLNEKWLIDFGFENLDWGYIIELDLDKTLRLVIHNGIYYPQIEQVPEFSNEDVQVVFLDSIEYVHQLQNLFFCLTGKQLNKKP